MVLCNCAGGFVREVSGTDPIVSLLCVSILRPTSYVLCRITPRVVFTTRKQSESTSNQNENVIHKQRFIIEHPAHTSPRLIPTHLTLYGSSEKQKEAPPCTRVCYVTSNQPNTPTPETLLLCPARWASLRALPSRCNRPKPLSARPRQPRCLPRLRQQCSPPRTIGRTASWVSLPYD